MNSLSKKAVFAKAPFLFVVGLLTACNSNVSKEPTNNFTVKRPVDAVVETLSHNQVQNTGNAGQNVVQAPDISDKTKFASRDYGVSGSPRVTKSKRVKKGGGTYKVGKPYTIRGKRYVPKEDPDYNKVGLASWYGPNFHGRLTANGEIYDQYGLSAAHPTLPLPSYAKVTNLENGASVTVRINDRGPYSRNRIIDLSSRAAQLLGYTKQGVAKVKVEYAGKARLDGLDEEFLVASYDPGSLNPATIPPNAGNPVLIADAGNQSKRNTLQAYNQTGFSAPLPEFRPATAKGFPVDISSLNAPRPGRLVNGFASEYRQGDHAYSAIEKQINVLSPISPPEAGMNDIQQLIIREFDDATGFEIIEKLLLKWGPTTIETSSDVIQIRASVLKTDLPKIVEQLSSKGVHELHFVK